MVELSLRPTRCLADVIVVDDVSQAREEAGDLVMAGETVWSRVVPLADVVVGKARGRLGDESITIFKSLGIAWRTWYLRS
ncbi:hypothetical protein [Vulcanisaeta sp. JCM 14467]|uniref:hypothetical protein n=1 Tax=Vulcanisaeta sp. JCM 14467 TaxID=1295370 RepID=UPI0020921515|nr:hypothetical protein [Vulcanisaeta sp. JCM 14467]